MAGVSCGDGLNQNESHSAPIGVESGKTRGLGMLVRTIWLSTCVLVLGGCALMQPGSSGDSGRGESTESGPDTAPVRFEEVHVVGEELPPLQPESPPAEESTGVLEDLRRKIDAARSGNPEPGDAASQRSTSRAATPSSQGLKAPDDPNLAPMAGRVGIMSLLGNDLRHIHASPPFGGHTQNYNVQYDFNGYVVEELRKSLLKNTPYQPVMVNGTAALRQAGTTWQDTWDGERFAPTFQREFDGIMEQNRLVMIIVVSYTNLSDGLMMGGQKLSGSGLYTRKALGKTSTAVFSTLQFHRVASKPARLLLPVAPANDRSVGDLSNVALPKDLENLPPRYLVPVYEPLRTIVQNKIHGLISLPRKLGF